MNVRLLEPAQAELDEAVAWYADQAPGLGDAFLLEMLKVLTLIDQFPQAWAPAHTPDPSLPPTPAPVNMPDALLPKVRHTAAFMPARSSRWDCSY